MANISLRYYLVSRYAAILMVLVLSFALSIIYLQFYDMDDTAEYYMQYEAQMLTNFYQAGDEIEEFDLGFKEYYWRLTSLPEKYQSLIADSPPENNQLNLYQNGTHDIYIYPYQINNNNVIVVHLFSRGDYGDSFAYTNQFIFIISTLLLLLTVVAIAWISRKAVTEINSFQRWLETLKNTKQEKELIPIELVFTELQQAATTLIHSQNSERVLQRQDAERVTREKAFLSTLSHELRTPIAIISAATTLLEKRGTLSAKDTTILAKLAKANGKMKTLTNTLLQLWRKQESNQAKEQVDLLEAVTSATESCKQSIAADITFVINNKQIHKNKIQTKIEAYSELVDITLQNILRNACQYSANQKVIISLDNHQLTVKNTIEVHPKGTSSNNALPDDNTYPDYGFGLGLYLVENICNLQQWRLEIDKSSNEFQVHVSFGD